MEPPPRQPNGVTRVLNRIFFEWLAVHMDVDCPFDAALPHHLLEYHPEHGLQLQLYPRMRPEHYQHQPTPLHFQSMEIYEDRRYLVTLEKGPYIFYLHKLTVHNVPLSHQSSRATMIGSTNVEEIYLQLPYGRYRIRCEGSHNFEYLISLEVTRVATPSNI